MRWILALLGGLFGAMAEDEAGLVGGLVLGWLIGWAIDRERARKRYLAGRADAVTASGGGPVPGLEAQIEALTLRVQQLERTVAALTAREHAAAPSGPRSATAAPVDAPLPEVPATPAPSAPPSTQDAAAGSDIDAFWREQEATSQEAREATQAQVSGAGVEPAPPSGPERALAALRAFFVGGNTVVRVGVLVLTVGIGLLVKYAADQAYLPLELRLAFAAASGLALVALGFRLRTTRPGFATALQGGGIAAMYLVTFFAYYAYQLLPDPLTLALLAAIAALSSILAVAQDAVQLAVFGAIGGFLAPVLASRGGGSHIALFSYYALLNGAIAAIALFRAWRLLNWVGFVFTFGVASLWGALRYEPAHMASASFFLALFFGFYVLVGTLYARKLLGSARGTVDTTLTFGTPLATLGLAAGLFRHEHLLLALACALMAAVYLGLAALLLRRRDAALVALAQAYVALGVGVATLAIPFALESALGTALAWAAEASGLVWIGVRQARLRTRIAGYVLFAGSLLALVARTSEASAGGRALFGALIALALVTSAARIARAREALRSFEPQVGRALFAAGLLVTLAAWEALITGFVPAAYHAAAWLGALALSTLALELGGTQLRFDDARRVARFAGPLLACALPPALGHADHPFADLAWLGWLAAIASALWTLSRQEAELASQPTLRDVLHATAAYVITLLLAVEAARGLALLSLAEGWRAGLALLALMGVPWLVLRNAPRWPVAAHPRAYAQWTAWPLVLFGALAALIVQAEGAGSPAPLPYVPLLNPLELATCLVLATVLALARSEPLRAVPSRRAAGWVAALVGFATLNGAVVRTAHHWAGVPFEPWRVPRAPLVQATFSILWTALALVAMMLAHRRGARAVWVAGASLLAVVVLKLFFVDLEKLSSVFKIVTFLAVGVLLLLIGYFAPVPPAARDERSPS